jgi:hypothetical protein
MNKYNFICFLGQEQVPKDTFVAVWTLLFKEHPSEDTLQQYQDVFDMSNEKSHESYDYDGIYR